MLLREKHIPNRRQLLKGTKVALAGNAAIISAMDIGKKSKTIAINRIKKISLDEIFEIHFTLNELHVLPKRKKPKAPSGLSVFILLCYEQLLIFY